MKVLYGSCAGAGRALNFDLGGCVVPDTVVGVDMAGAFQQVIQFVDTDLSCFIIIPNFIIVIPVLLGIFKKCSVLGKYQRPRSMDLACGSPDLHVFLISL